MASGTLLRVDVFYPRNDELRHRLADRRCVLPGYSRMPFLPLSGLSTRNSALISTRSPEGFVLETTEFNSGNCKTRLRIKLLPNTCSRSSRSLQISDIDRIILRHVSHVASRTLYGHECRRAKSPTSCCDYYYWSDFG